MKHLPIKSALIALFMLALFYTSQVSASQTDLVGPAGSGTFGDSMTVLPNGNLVVTDPTYSIPGGAANVGAVYLYDGATLNLISALTGSTANDRVSFNGGVKVLSNGNYVIASPSWNNNRGAVTFGSATSGVSGVVSSSNSLVGSNVNDAIGFEITTLTNGNYVASSNYWNSYHGASTFGSGTTGVSGIVSSANSLVGSNFNDYVGIKVTPLTNGNYVVSSFNWNGFRGAATFGNGASGISGEISGSNSLVGSNANDYVSGNITALTNGNYVVASSNWNNQFGAVTFGNGTTGISGTISSSNSLVGSVANDAVGFSGVTALPNGNYVVGSEKWNISRGAATFGNGTTGTSGVVSNSNSLVGSHNNDSVGTSITPLTNNNYVVSSPTWNGDIGAVTFGDGTTGYSGVVSLGNSLIGSNINDSIGSGGITALTNGNYVVASPNWKSGVAPNTGAVTFGNGSNGIVGIVARSNSLIGLNQNERVGSGGVTALTNGNYVVSSPNWNFTSGAVTFGDGTTGISGFLDYSNSLGGTHNNDFVGTKVIALTNGNYVVASPNWSGNTGNAANTGAVTFVNNAARRSGGVDSSNSLIGSAVNDRVGSSVIALTNGNYVVNSPSWNGNRGAVTFANGAIGLDSTTVSGSNSLVGSTANDGVGNNNLIALSNGNYVVDSPGWDNGAIVNAGAYTFGSGAVAMSGAITNGATGGNSIVGTTANGANTFTFDPTRNRLFVGRKANNRVSVLFFTTTAIADGNISDAATFDNGFPGGIINAVIPNGRTIALNGISYIGQVSLDCTAMLTGAAPFNYIVGNVRRNFCAASGASFTYPIGDPYNYSPVTASNVNGTGALTVTVTTQTLPGLPAALSAARFWNLDGAGITTDLTFQYLADDIRGTESSYRVNRRFGTNNIPYATTIDTAAHTAKVTGISNFSPWGIGNTPIVAGPTAAEVSISGRVILPTDLGLSGALVTLTDSSGTPQTVKTGKGGSFIFRNVASSETYILSAASKGYTFAPQIISPTENLAGITFTAQ